MGLRTMIAITTANTTARARMSFVAAATNDILARAVVFGVVIAIIVLRPKGLFALKGR